MMKFKYETISNFLKVFFLLIGGGIPLFKENIDEKIFLAFNVSAIALVLILLLTVFDKLREDQTREINGLYEHNKKINNELMKELLLLTEKVKANFEYHGLLDSPRERFNANEMREIWPIVIARVKKELLAVNYLSPEMWNDGKGDDLVPLLGSKINLFGLRAKRLFIVDELSELDRWSKTFDLHNVFNIPIKYMLKSDYEAIKDEYSSINKLLADSNGFNIIDSDSPGITIDWEYINRKTTGARLKAGSEIAVEYKHFFERLWDCSRSHSIQKVTNLHTIKQLS